jgi:hypothetical protein
LIYPLPEARHLELAEEVEEVLWEQAPSGLKVEADRMEEEQPGFFSE